MPSPSHEPRCESVLRIRSAEIKLEALPLHSPLRTFSGESFAKASRRQRSNLSC
jgi:hypothetical protein